MLTVQKAIARMPHTHDELSLTLLATWPELARLKSAVALFAEQHHWSESDLFHVKLVLEEIIANVINHGSKGIQTASIQVHIHQQEQLLSIVVADTGLPFNPLQMQAPDISAGIEDRQLGGLGVFMVREFTNSAAYEYLDGWNRLSLTKQLRF